MTTNSIITATLVPESSRMDVAGKHFGIRFPLTVEPTAHFAERDR